jgi:uncharacterized lipoprotein
MRTLLLASVIALSACGSNSENPAGKDLEDAAAQSDPEAAAVINQAIESGMNEQEALARAGQAATANAQTAEGRPPSGTVQAVPNTVQTPNRPDGTSPPAKGTGSTAVPGLQQGGEPRQPQPSGG